MYARYSGYSLLELYKLSQRLIGNSRSAKFREAYNLSYCDIYDFSSKKQSLKKWQIELGLNHKELGMPWDKEVPEDRWEEVASYCVNDVITTKQTFYARLGDFKARQILAEWAGEPVGTSTNNCTTKIIFGNERKPKLVYTDLSKEFPGYYYEYVEDNKGVKHLHNYYRGEDVGKGGYVWANPGMYGNVSLDDSASHHPVSAIELNYFGEYTSRFKDILDLRIFIKRKEFDKAKQMFDGRFARYLDDEDLAKDLAQALKIAINACYGMTSASYDNPMRDIRNVNNIVALRGALFLVDLRHALEDAGYEAIHFKTDSSKVANAGPEVPEFISNFGKKYGYTFEHEAIYDRLCLLNDAVYVAREGRRNAPIFDKKGEYIGPWTATGTQLIHPYVFKSLFSKQPIEFLDMCETKSVMSPAAMYLDMDEGLSEGEHNYQFVGKAGLFCPIKEGLGGGRLVRNKGDDKYNSVTGAKDWKWLEAAVVKELGKEDDIDLEYFNTLVEKARKDISQYGDFDWFVSEQPYDKEDNGIYPF